jgi:uncharacterized membrane protein (DUF373 family)
MRGRYGAFVGTWNTLSLYERFEQTIALVLTALIAVIIVIALWDLTGRVLAVALSGQLHPLEQQTFQGLFSQILILLIALEFKHSIIRVVAYRQSIIQVRTVLLIAILAIARKLIILDLDHYSAQSILGLAAVTATLGITYWLIRDRDARTDAQEAGYGHR